METAPEPWGEHAEGLVRCGSARLGKDSPAVKKRQKPVLSTWPRMGCHAPVLKSIYPFRVIAFVLQGIIESRQTFCGTLASVFSWESGEMVFEFSTKVLIRVELCVANTAYP